MTKWIIVAGVIATMAACTSDQLDEEDDAQASCERIDIEQAEYCIYEQPITETGYDCPMDLQHPIPMGGRTVCSATEEIPEEHQRPLREHLDDQEPHDGGLDSDTRDGEGCGPLVCDAIYIPAVTFSFSQPDGNSFCGDVKISYWSEGEEDSPTTKTCTCAQIEQGSDAGYNSECVIDPPAGEFVTVTVEATEAAYDNYAVFETSVDLPCYCHPSDDIHVEFETQ